MFLAFFVFSRGAGMIQKPDMFQPFGSFFPCLRKFDAENTEGQREPTSARSRGLSSRNANGIHADIHFFDQGAKVGGFDFPVNFPE